MIPDPILRANTTPVLTPNLQDATVVSKDAQGFTCPDVAEFVGLVTDPSLAGVLPMEEAGTTLGAAMGGMAGATVEVIMLLQMEPFWLLAPVVTCDVCFGGEYAAVPELLDVLEDRLRMPVVQVPNAQGGKAVQYF